MTIIGQELLGLETLKLVTIAQQLSKAVWRDGNSATPILSTRAGCECLAHLLQGITEVNPDAHVTSVDGVSAYDSRVHQKRCGIWQV